MDRRSDVDLLCDGMAGIADPGFGLCFALRPEEGDDDGSEAHGDEYSELGRSA